VYKTLSILHILDKNRLTTGSVVQMMEAARGLADRGRTVSVAGPPGGELKSVCDDAGVDFLPLGLSGPLDLRSSRVLRRVIRTKLVDVIHAHKGCPHSVALLASTGLGRRPAIVVNRGVVFPLDHFNRWKYRHRRVRAVVCVADAVRRVVIESGGLEPARVHTVYSGTDVERFHPDRVDRAMLRAELELGPDQPLIAQVSVRDWKGWRELLAGFAQVLPQFPTARLLLVGCEPETELRRVRSAAAELSVATAVMTLPFRRDMPQVLAACDIVADASWAGTGITGTIREAMALGRAVVATDCGGNSELVIDGECGLVVPPRDVEVLGKALRRLLGDGGLRTTLGNAARERVLDGFTTVSRIDRLEEIYREAVGGHAHEPA
jgi:glycosyltransferase involved in cell wall biosynthesis